MRLSFALALLVLGALSALGQTAAPPASASGIDPTSLDRTCKPCDDFWRFANGGWIDRNPIPARYPSWGTLSVMTEANRERLRTLLENAAASAPTTSNPNIKKLGNFYSSCMDTAAIDAAGLKPLDASLKRIDAIADRGTLKSTLLQFQKDGRIGPFGIGGGPDLKDSQQIIITVMAGGLSLPERDYYFKSDDRTTKIRDEFLVHVQRMLVLSGHPEEQAAAEARQILAFETKLADATMTNVQRRDPYARYHKMTLSGLAELAPALDWKAALQLLQLPEASPINVSEPDFLKRVQQQLADESLDTWKVWLRWRVIHAAAPTLAKPFYDENFRFSSTVLTGVREQLPRWQVCSTQIDQSMGDALGALFVEKHFPPAAKARMNELVENLRATLRDSLQKADWLEEDTRKNAVAKLNAFVAKIGYPDRWRDYSSLTITPNSYFANVHASLVLNREYQLAKVGKPVDRNDWGMTPPTVNAYYNPPRNEIAFPAGILQPPLFDMNADDAVNYGAIGAVIGHEMGHGFDDQGSKFDAAGNLKNWWTDQDRKKFETRAGCVIDEFNTLEVGDGLHHNGNLVVGEAMGDLGGLTLAYRAWQRSLQGKPAPPVIDGFTAQQRFFLAFARAWGTHMRPEATRLRLNTDPHPLAKFRANGTLQNMPEFFEAFQCKAGDPMVRPKDKQCQLW